LTLVGQGRGGVRVDDADHAVIDAGTRGGAVVEDGERVVDADGEGGWVGEDGVDGLEAGEEADLVDARVFIRNARVQVFGADDRVVCWVKVVFCSNVSAICSWAVLCHASAYQHNHRLLLGRHRE